MHTISWTWFWYLLAGFLLGGSLVYVWQTFQKMSIKFIWYEWVLTILGILIFVFMFQTFIASLEEGQTRAAWMSLIFFGIPVILIVVGVTRSIQARLVKSK